MANSLQARKRARQNLHQRTLNATQRSAMRTSVKRFHKTLGGSDVEAARSAYQNATSLIDRAATKHLHHRNRAARLKRRLNARLKTFSQSA